MFYNRAYYLDVANMWLISNWVNMVVFHMQSHSGYGWRIYFYISRES